jgi:hypothetical protein
MDVRNALAGLNLSQKSLKLFDRGFSPDLTSIGIIAPSSCMIKSTSAVFRSLLQSEDKSLFLA